MKSLKSSFLKILCLAVLISFLSACASQKSYDNLTSYPEDGREMEKMEEGDSDSTQNFSEILEGEKVISTYYMNIETLNFEKSNENLSDLIKKHKSFIENSDIRFRGFEYSKNFRYGDFSIRIPKENVDGFKKDLKTIGNVSSESTNKEDVTNFYRDTESRLKLVTSKEKRLLDLLEKAVKIEDIISIESELTDTIYEKEMLEKSLKSVDEKIEYATLNLELIEVRSFSNVNTADSSLGLRVKNAIKDSMFAFKLAIENFIIFLIFVFPYFMIILPIAVIVIWLIKKRRNRSL